MSLLNQIIEINYFLNELLKLKFRKKTCIFSVLDKQAHLVGLSFCRFIKLHQYCNVATISKKIIIRLRMQIMRPIHPNFDLNFFIDKVPIAIPKN